MEAIVEKNSTMAALQNFETTSFQDLLNPKFCKVIVVMRPGCRVASLRN